MCEGTGWPAGKVGHMQSEGERVETETVMYRRADSTDVM